MKMQTIITKPMYDVQNCKYSDFTLLSTVSEYVVVEKQVNAPPEQMVGTSC